MPKVSNDLIWEIQQDYTTRKFGQKPKELEFVDKLDAIDVKIYNAPSIAEFRKTLSIFLLNTWNDKIETDFDEKDVDVMIKELFRFELLPTAMETIGLTWWVNGLDMIDTTHLIRHRLFSFAAQVHGDRDMRDDRVVVNPGISANTEFYERYKEITRQAHSLYIDMMDSGLVNGLDTRTIMPRNFEHFYMVRCNIKDAIGYCNMRRDEAIQTQVDNVVALKLWLEIVSRYPFLRSLVNFNKPDEFYVRQCKKGKRNFFPPNPKNDLFDWCEEQFYHPIGRDEFPGGDVYLNKKAELLELIELAESQPDDKPLIA
jgi:hypothetical protein